MIIALDGPAASGKGTLARILANHYGLRHLDTGSLYRAVARDMIDLGNDLRDPLVAATCANEIDANTLNDPRLREPGIGEGASIVAGLNEVRDALLHYQRKFAATAPGAILDGRDIGTVVCPNADVKIFVTASAEERARRRFNELKENNPDLSLEDVLAEIHRRDERDSSRSISPLEPAKDAYLLDTTNLAIETAYKLAVELIDARLQNT